MSKLNFITEYPLWFSIFCVLIGAAYAGFLYYRSKLAEEISPWLKWLLLTCRFSAVTILAFLLLGPLLRTLSRTVVKPVIIIAQDDSESIIIGKDSAYYQTDYLKKIEELSRSLSDDFEVVTYSFGSKVKEGISLSFSEKETDISEVFDEIETRYDNTKVGAVILASDGIYNKGLNPVYRNQSNFYPVYAIALGDTAVKKDLIVSRVIHNSIAYLGNSFPLEIQIDAKRLAGQPFVLSVVKGTQTLFSQNITSDREKYSVTIPVMLEAKEPGIQRYVVKVSRVEGEVSYVNNEQTIFVEVLDGRQKVLILANNPHPDIAALRQTIEFNDNYEVDAVLASDFKSSFKEYDLVILHQLPSVNNPALSILEDLKKSKVPRLFILGNLTSFNHFNALQTGLNIALNPGRQNDSRPSFSKEFPVFTLSEATQKALKRFPPLLSPFGTYKVAGSANVLFYQLLGNVETKDPLLLFDASGEEKTGVLAGEGLWRWRMIDFVENKNQNAFNEIVGKIVQFLSVKADKSRFRVVAGKSYFENRAIEFDAELYNESYELVNDPDVAINITNSEKNKFPFVFSKTSNAYRLNAGILPVGEYKWEAKVKVGEKILAQSGEFSVNALQIEALNSEADHGLLYSLAERNGGSVVYPADMDKLLEVIKSREDIKPVVYSNERLDELINLKWVFFLLLLLLSLEWFFRKRSGAY
jgi:hypothetical protein